MNQRSGIKAILLDMDGVLFHGDHALSGAAELLTAIARTPHCFVTNNPIRTPTQVVAHFVKLGLPAPLPSQIVTSAEATAAWLAREKPGYRFYAVGAPGLGDALEKTGTPDDRHADFVVVGEGPGLDYKTLTTGINLVLKHGARLIGTNPDQNVDASVDGGHCVFPGGGALIAPFAVATGCQPVFIGKPYPMLYQMAMGKLGVGANDCLMIGDRPDTDIAGAAALGMQTALVRTGRCAPGEELPPGVTPDWDCTDLGMLLNCLDRTGWLAGYDGSGRWEKM